MTQEDSNTENEIDVANLILVVVGAHLRAEMADRPIAYKLCQQMEQWIKKYSEQMNISLMPVVCSDVWYVNQPSIQQRPTISLGGPGVNALSAYYADKLQSVLVHDDHMVIQLDPEFVDLRASVWGMNHELTVSVVDLFATKYVDRYLRAVATQVEPHEG